MWDGHCSRQGAEFQGYSNGLVEDETPQIYCMVPELAGAESEANNAPGKARKIRLQRTNQAVGYFRKPIKNLRLTRFLHRILHLLSGD